MMENKFNRLLILLTVCLFSTNMQGQTSNTPPAHAHGKGHIDIDQSNGLFNISEYNWKGTTYLIPQDRKFADLNSTITIDINSDAVASRINKKAGSTPETDALVQQIASLTPIIRKSNKVLSDLADSVKTLNPDDTVNYLKKYRKIYFNSLKLYNEVYPLIRHNDRLNKMVNDTLGKAIFNSDLQGYQILNIVFLAISNYVNEINGQLSKIIDDEGIKIQLAATLNGAKGAQTELPLPGYDNAATPGFYDPYAFALALDSNQMQQLKQFQNASDSFNAQGFKNFFTNTGNLLKTQAPKEALFALDSVIIPSFSIPVIENIINDTAASLQNIRAGVTTLVSAVKLTEGTVKNIIDEVSHPGNSNGPQLQAQLIGDAATVVNNVKSFINTCNDIRKNIDTLKGEVKGFNKAALVIQLDSVKARLMRMNNLGALGTALQAFGDMGASVSSVTLFGNTIVSHTLSDMPLQTEIDLKHAGYRQHGDEVRIEMRIVDKNGKATTLGYQRILLFKEEAGFELQATFGFINQLVDKKPESLFHAAPSTTILFKFPVPNCKNITYRKYIDFGVGLNIATFNFNPNTFTEVGLGVVFSCFNIADTWRNVLQGGIGYNLVGNKMYGMIGLNIPFLGFSSDLK